MKRAVVYHGPLGRIGTSSHGQSKGIPCTVSTQAHRSPGSSSASLPLPIFPSLLTCYSIPSPLSPATSRLPPSHFSAPSPLSMHTQEQTLVWHVWPRMYTGSIHSMLGKCQNFILLCRSIFIIDSFCFSYIALWQKIIVTAHYALGMIFFSFFLWKSLRTHALNSLKGWVRCSSTSNPPHAQLLYMVKLITTDPLLSLLSVSLIWQYISRLICLGQICKDILEYLLVLNLSLWLGSLPLFHS